jgi:integrase
MASSSIGYRERSKKWEARWRDADGRQRSKLFTRKRDAQQHLAVVTADLARGDYLDPARGRVTVADVAAEWQASTTHLKPSTRAGYGYILDASILPALGHRQVATVRSSDVRAFVSEMQASGSAPGTVRNTFRVLKMVMQVAVDDERIKKNPCQGVKLPRSEHREQNYLTAEQVAAVASEMPESYRTVVFLAAYGGLRWGEIAALRWGRVDLMRRTVEVAESVKRVKGELHFGPPKTAAGRRVVRIPRFLAEMLTVEQARTEYDPTAFVFTSPRGGPMSPETVTRRHFKRAARLAVPERPGLRFHDLRHTCASLLIAQGAHPKAIQRHLGHSTVVVTLDRYGHIFPEESDRLADALDATYQQASRGTARNTA